MKILRSSFIIGERKEMAAGFKGMLKTPAVYAPKLLFMNPDLSTKRDKQSH